MVLDHPIHLEEGDDEEDIFVSPQTLSTIRLELRAAVADLSARGLKLAAKWAAEQLAGLRQPSTNMERPAGIFSGPRAWEGWVEEEAGEDEGTAPAEFSDAFLVAKACFDTGEYRRAAHVLQVEKEEAGIEGGMEGGGEGEASLPARTINQEELFLRSYASYLAGEKVKRTDGTVCR
ncbi:anaphase promoting complex subunit 8 [Nannochloropsis gaditana CCMP526]|uniref:anaphase promoting complex subunit 8 n=1 Tax=Nannochloropsis gaditana (strain CCMP526) TaxID=1093141 RepID=UPI00029F72FD|nr:anaphase promoting complex subunit 8 [Nannochloropsis gaditana CCMP526]EKU21608.1 anaphase promoting complex subunit 8 [Nannochloropsis gaditana CCMP526]|eukprot:XP_005854748.1 anaphase promoting complex subunit 8 [Nannochloropsis gaditana CCMP526]